MKTQKYFFIAPLLLLFYGCSQGQAMLPENTNKVTGEITTNTVDEIKHPYMENKLLTLYSHLGLEPHVTFEAFEQAMAGYEKIQSREKDILTLVDFTKPSTEERLFVIDVLNEKVLFKSHVSHGRNSGENYATSFSNVKGSYKSSLGFYMTNETYQGSNGYSLRIDGLEKGINDNARERAIVIHGADYANPSVIQGSGRLGRSLGCPALPRALNKDIIDVIKDGSVLFIYANDNDYADASPILSSSMA